MAQTTYEGVRGARNQTTVTRGSDTTFTASTDGVAVVINTDTADVGKDQVLKLLRDVMAVISKDMNAATFADDLPTTGSFTT
jgi:hypothetical protein